MGGCGSKSDADPGLDEAIMDTLQDERRADEDKMKLLLLGAGESGKSTIFKQMRHLYGTGFTEVQRKSKVADIKANIIDSIKSLVKATEDLEECSKVEAKESKAVIDSLTVHDDEITPDMVKHIKILWADSGIQNAYALRSKFQLNDTAGYFLENVETVCSDGWVPSVSEVMKVRVRTTALVDEEFIIDDVTFVMFDVGGQRSERKKWIHCFEGVTAVIFVAAISEYNQVLFEATTVNRMMESLELFNQICNCRYFEETDMILFLNKRDLFEDKIKTHDIRQPDPSDPENTLFEDYEGGCDYDSGVSYILQKYLDQNNQDKAIYHHVTCATDTKNIQTVFQACKEIIFQQNIAGSMYLGDE